MSRERLMCSVLVVWAPAVNHVGDVCSVRVDFDDGLELGTVAEPIEELPLRLDQLFARMKEEVLRRAGVGRNAEPTAQYGLVKRADEDEDEDEDDDPPW